MSEYLRAAREKLRSAVADIDARLSELETERAELLATRAELLGIIGDAPQAITPGPLPIVPWPSPPPSPHQCAEVRHEAVGETTGGRPSAPPASRPTAAHPPSLKVQRRAEATARIEVALAQANLPMRWPDVLKASKLSEAQTKRLVRELVETGRLLRTGQRRATRYSLPSGRARRGPAAAGAGKGSPADDDAHGAVQGVTSAGDAGVAPAPREADGLQQPVSRPPGDENVEIEQFVNSEESLGKGSIAHWLETDEIDDGLIDDDALESSPLDDDEQLELDAEPCIRKPGPKPKYKPGHRQLQANVEKAKTNGSWWMRPDADFTAEAERMRTAPPSRSTVVPSAHRVIGMPGTY